MLKILRHTNIFTNVSEEIVDILMEGNIAEEEIRFEIGKKLFFLRESLLRKNRDMYRSIAEEVLKQLPEQKGISSAELFEMERFYKAKSFKLTRFGEENPKKHQQKDI